MTSLDERNDGLIRIFLQDRNSGLGSGSRLVTVPQSVHNSRKGTLAERFDQMQIAGNGLSGNWL